MAALSALPFYTSSWDSIDLSVQSESDGHRIDYAQQAIEGEKDARRARYPSDLTDEQWELGEPALWRNGTRGRPRTVDLCEVVNAILYLVRTGGQWEYRPHDLPHRSTVRYYLRFAFLARSQSIGTRVRRGA